MSEFQHDCLMAAIAFVCLSIPHIAVQYWFGRLRYSVAQALRVAVHIHVVVCILLAIFGIGMLALISLLQS